MVIEDGLIKLKISDHIFEIIRPYCQMTKKMPESGGIIIGRENISNNNLIIETISEPMKYDKQKRNRFIRKDPEHIIWFEKLYEDSDKTLRYVGEWHTHPEDDPHYSLIDLNNWRRIKEEASNVVDYYHLIAGRNSVVIWKCCNDNKLPIKISIILWKDIASEKNNTDNKRYYN